MHMRVGVIQGASVRGFTCLTEEDRVDRNVNEAHKETYEAHDSEADGGGGSNLDKLCGAGLRRSVAGAEGGRAQRRRTLAVGLVAAPHKSHGVDEEAVKGLRNAARGVHGG